MHTNVVHALVDVVATQLGIILLSFFFFFPSIHFSLFRVVHADIRMGGLVSPRRGGTDGGGKGPMGGGLARDLRQSRVEIN